MDYVTTADSTRIYFKDWGNGSPVILIHGWPLSADSWDDQAMALAEAGHRVIAYDRRGFGRSSQPWQGYDYDTLAGTDQAAFDKSAQAMKADRAGFFTGFFRTFFGVGAATSPVSQELLEWARGIAMQASLKATLECARSFSSTDFRGDLSAFRVPTLIIHGTEDKTVPIDASSRAAAKGIAGSTLVEYEGAPHGLFATHKARLIKDLLDFTGR